MKTLSMNWFIEGAIDFEFKKYVLLDYLQEINRHFDRSQLYPNLTDLIYHYNNLLAFKQNKTVLQQNFPQRLSQADIEAVKLTYQKIVQDDNTMQEIEQIISYALHKMDPALQTGKQIYDFVESRLDIDPVGVIPLLPYNGYFTLRNGNERTNRVYEYQFTLFESKDDKYRGIHINLVDTFERNLVNTPESIKQHLIKHRRHLPNPAMYHVQSDISFPLEQTLLPVAKRSLVKYISDAA
jgi:benzoyl-CoA reductase/2-hydroxyglutaryl-CoA dehydratase subunit BcrC/BadD/HgdB